MENKAILLEPLLDNIEAYGKTSLELLKIKTLDKTAEVTSKVISQLFLCLILFLFIICLNIAVALWLGDNLGKNYYGFLIVASFYALAGIVLSFAQVTIRAKMNNSIIKQILK